MKFERFESLLDSMRYGCINRLSDMEDLSETATFNWYAQKHNELSRTLMALQIEYYDDET